MIEQRQFTRIEFDAQATLVHSNTHWPTRLLDISLKGALIEHPTDVELNNQDPVELTLLLSDGQTEIVMQGSVVHQENGHLGLVCDHLDVDSASHLRRLVELNTANEALLEREIEALIHFGT